MTQYGIECYGGSSSYLGGSMSNQLVLDSLQRRMKALFSLYDDAIDSMNLEHVNHFEREGVVPIAFCLFHYANVHDASFMLLSGQPPLWNDEWQARVGLTINDHGKHRTVDEMVHQRIGDLDAFAEYMRAVYARTSAWLEQLDPAELERVVIPRPLPPQIATTFSARVAGEQGVTVLDGVECWLYQHGLRHMGEIEMARGLVGLGGMTS